MLASTASAVRGASGAAGFLADHLSDVEWRSFQIIACERGAVLRGRLDAVGAATLRSALEPLARRAGAEDQRRRARRLGDAVVELAHHVLDTGVLPSQRGQRPHLQVTASVDTIRGLSGAAAGELEFSSPIPAATVQRLACDAGVTRVLFGAGSAIIDVGRKLHVPSPAQRRALARLRPPRGLDQRASPRPLGARPRHHRAAQPAARLSPPSLAPA